MEQRWLIAQTPHSGHGPDATLRGRSKSFIEDEVNRHDETEKCCQVVPPQRLAIEEQCDENREDGQRDDFLNHLQLHDAIGTAIAFKTDTVSRHLTTVLKEGYHP